MKYLSNGQPSTLGTYLAIAKACKNPPLPKAVEFLQQDIKAAAKGAETEVNQSENDMLKMLIDMQNTTGIK